VPPPCPAWPVDNVRPCFGVIEPYSHDTIIGGSGYAWKTRRGSGAGDVRGVVRFVYRGAAEAPIGHACPLLARASLLACASLTGDRQRHARVLRCDAGRVG